MLENWDWELRQNQLVPQGKQEDTVLSEVRQSLKPRERRNFGELFEMLCK